MAASEVGVRQGCPLSPTLFNIFLERIKVSIGGRNITNLRFADDTDALAEEELELGALVQTLDKGCTKNKMEISAEKTKLLKKKKKKQRGSSMRKGRNWVPLQVSSISEPQMVAQNQRFSLNCVSNAGLAKLKTIWRDMNIYLGSKVMKISNYNLHIFQIITLILK